MTPEFIQMFLTWFPAYTAIVGSLAWLLRSTYRGAIYLAQIRDTLQDLTSGVHALQTMDDGIERRLKDVEHYLAKTTDFVIRGDDRSF